MPKVMLLVGIPGSGKSTYAKLYLDRYERLSADDIRKELYGDAGNQGNPSQVFSVFFNRLKILLKENKDIVIDNTNCKKEHRDKLLKFIKETNTFYDVEYYFVDTSLKKSLDRNSQRSRKVPEEIVYAMYRSLHEDGDPLTMLKKEAPTIKVIY